MIKAFKTIVVIFAFSFELLYFFAASVSLHGYILDEQYRHKERLVTVFARVEHSTPETEAAYQKEVNLLDEHIWKRSCIIFVVFLFADALLIYWYRRKVPLTKLAQPPEALKAAKITPE
jgi:hypothetical protein